MKLAATAKFIIKSLIAERATGLFAVVALILLALSLSLSDINIAVKYRLLEDALFASQSFMMNLAAIFYAFLAMEKERKGGIFVFIISSGTSRSGYLLSQFGAIFTLISTVFAIFLAVDFGFLSAFADSVKPDFLAKLLFSAMSASMLGFLTLFLSRFVSNTNAVIYAIFLFFIGNGADELMLYAADKNSLALEILANIVYFGLPNFSFFDPLALKTAISKELFVPLYFAIYSTLMFGAALFRLKKEVLRVG